VAPSAKSRRPRSCRLRPADRASVALGEDIAVVPGKVVTGVAENAALGE